MTTMLKLQKEDVARILEDIATLLELRGENPFRIRAYLNAAHAILNLEEDFEKLVMEERLTDSKGIGEDLCQKICTLATTGTLPFYEDLKNSVPKQLYELLSIPGLAGKKIKALHEILKIDSIESLKKACLEDKVSQLRGFGEKTQANILKGIENLQSYGRRYLWWTAMEIAAPLLKQLRSLPGVTKAEIAGSIRRKLETVGDLDFVVAAADPKPIMDWFTSLPNVDKIIAHGPSKSSVRLLKGIQAELRIVPDKQFAFALCYSTGSKNHSIKVRQHAVELGYSLSEWGLAVVDSKKKDPFSKLGRDITEADIYQALKMQYIPPELREDMGEVEAALAGKIPTLIEMKDIKGTFHVHTAASDGRASLETMIQAAEAYQWEYVGISDHSKSSFQANGLHEEGLLEQVEQIRKINQKKQFKIHVFAGVECDILIDGTLDFSDAILKQLDFVIASVHSSLHQDEQTMTKRLIKAIENPYTTMVGHVSGRQLLRREGSSLEYQKVIDACIANGKIMELNAQPFRMDMDWRYWHKAAEKGLKCSINPDAHTPESFELVWGGVNVAKKGWLEKRHIVNTLPLSQIKKVLGRDVR